MAVTFDPHPMAVLRPEHAPPTLTDDRPPGRAARRGRGRRRARAPVLPASRGLDAGASSSTGSSSTRCTPRRSWSARTSASARKAAGDVATLRELGARPRLHASRASRSTAGRRCGPRPTSAPAWPPATSRAPPRRSAARSPCAARSSRATSAAASSATRPPTCRPTGMRGARRRRVRRLAAPRSTTPAAASCCPAAISVGTNPTFAGERERRVEAYVLDRDRPRALRRAGRGRPSSRRIRGMVRFDGVDDARRDDGRRRRAHPRAPRAPRVSRSTAGRRAPLPRRERVVPAARAALLRARAPRRRSARALQPRPHRCRARRVDGARGARASAVGLASWLDDAQRRGPRRP